MWCTDHEDSFGGFSEIYFQFKRAGIAPPAESQHLCALYTVLQIPGWSDSLKHLWDSDTRKKIPLKVVVLGSAPLLIQQGLTESLAGRFEVIRAPHWSWSEMQEAFGWSLDQYLYYGAYPGSAGLIGEPERWSQYVRDSLVETTLSPDILLMTRVDKPALLRRMFHLACDYSGQILSSQKLVGQLTDAGNTVTLAHYLDLLGGAGMVTGLQEYSHRAVRTRGSSPKLPVDHYWADRVGHPPWEYWFSVPGGLAPHFSFQAGTSLKEKRGMSVRWLACSTVMRKMRPSLSKSSRVRLYHFASVPFRSRTISTLCDPFPASKLVGRLVSLWQIFRVPSSKE